MAKYVKLNEISLKNHPELNEKWVQKIIADNPDILGLGKLQVKDIERVQPHAGRLDLLLYDEGASTRYEVEIQLGKTDESHIIRTIEYWDIERNRYPSYEHVAVIVAEDITSRFLNVISLFNKTIPLIAIQMKAVKLNEDDVSLFFTKVVDLMPIGEDENDSIEITDRNYWIAKSTKKILALVDKILGIIIKIAPEYMLNYNKHYIGLCKDGVSNNFVSFIPRKHRLQLRIRIPRGEEIGNILEEKFDCTYDQRYSQYLIQLSEDDISNNEELITKVIKMAYNDK